MMGIIKMNAVTPQIYPSLLDTRINVLDQHHLLLIVIMTSLVLQFRPVVSWDRLYPFFCSSAASRHLPCIIDHTVGLNVLPVLQSSVDNKFSNVLLAGIGVSHCLAAESIIRWRRCFDGFSNNFFTPNIGKIILKNEKYASSRYIN